MQIPSKLRKLTRFQRVTLVLFVAVILNSILDYTVGYQLYGGDLLGVLFGISLFVLAIRSLRPITRRVLWRLRNRLLVTYVLFGVVPLVLISIMLAIGSFILFGQITANMVRNEIDRRTDLTYAAAQDLALRTLYGVRSAESVPGLRAVVKLGADATRIPNDGIIQDIPAWLTPGFKGILRIDDQFFLAAFARTGALNRTANVLAYSPLDSELLADLARDLGTVTIAERSIRRRGVNVSVKTSPNTNPFALVTSGRPLPEGRGWWDWTVPWGSMLEAKDLEGNAGGLVFTVTSRPSLFIPRMFSNLGTLASLLGYVLMAIVAVFLVVECVSLILSMRLTRSITRAVHDLYVGTQRVAALDFSHRIPVRTTDQLSELASSFNSMTEHIVHLIEEVKGKEKLEAELEIAREVQSQLFPKGVPKLKTLELAGVCNPARVVSGDYYDFVPFDTRWTAIVIGDIAGKGISAALLMASVQASLHAQLSAMDERRTGDVNVAGPSTAVIVARLNSQLYESTSSEKYATFYCAMYDDQNGRLSYTNAGHLPPILVRNGQASRLEGHGMVVGIQPDTPYEQVVIQLQPGDLVAAFTDGITESENSQHEEFGEKRLAETLVTNAARPLDEIVEVVIGLVREWASDLGNQDDTTMLLARRL